MFALVTIALLTVQQGAAANVARKPRRATSLLETSTHHRLRRIFDEAAPATTAAASKLTEGQKLIAADMEAEEDFVRKCQVVVTVSDDKFLPVKPLDRFCQTTDAAMECRLKVGERLKETHARDGDMGKFCLAVYGWFQTKYGAKCPEQCRKLQCKSTCMWLETKKGLDKENSEIKDGMKGAKKALEEVKEVGKQVEEKKKEESKREFTIKMINTKIGRAEKDLAEKKSFLKTTQERSKKFNKQVDDLEAKIAATEARMITQEDSMQKQKFAIDKAKGKLENLERNAVRDLERAKEDRAEEKSLRSEASRLGKEIDDLNKEKASLTDTLNKDKQEISKQKTAWKGKVDKLKEAMNSLADYAKDQECKTDKYAMPDKFEAEYKRRLDACEYKSDPSVEDFKELMSNQYKRAKDSEKILDELNAKATDTQQEIDETKNEIARLSEKKQKAEKSANAAKAKASSLEASGKSAMDQAKTIMKDQVTEPTKTLNKAKEKYAGEEASKAKDEKTLEFSKEAANNEDTKLKVAYNDVTAAEQHLQKQKDDLTQAQGWLKDTQKEKKDLEAKQKELKEELAKDEKSLSSRIKAYKTATKDLDKHKPEIVRQHGCAVLSNCQRGEDALDGGWKAR